MVPIWFTTEAFLTEQHGVMDYCRTRLIDRERLVTHYTGKHNPRTTNIDNINVPNIEFDCIRKKFYKLEKILKDEVQHHLDHSLLDIYISENIVPRGLRLRVEPSFKDDKLFINVWDTHLQNCSLGLLKILKDKRSQLLHDKTQQIQTLSTELAQFKSMEGFTSLDRTLTTHITQFEKEVIEKKSNKLNRDRTDYATGNVKYWLNKESINSSNNTPIPRSIPARRPPLLPTPAFNNINRRDTPGPPSTTVYRNRTFSYPNKKNNSNQTTHYHPHNQPLLGRKNRHNTIPKALTPVDNIPKPLVLPTLPTKTAASLLDTDVPPIPHLQLQHTKVTSVIASLELMGATQSTSLNLPSTSFTGSALTTARPSVHFQNPITTHIPLTRIISSSSDSTLLDDSLYTICNTPGSNKPLEAPIPLDSNTNNDGFDISNLGASSLPHISAVSFLDLPPLLATTPTYHIKETPNITRITRFFNPLSLKRKHDLDEEQEEVENIIIDPLAQQMETNHLNLKTPKRNKTSP